VQEANSEESAMEVTPTALVFPATADTLTSFPDKNGCLGRMRQQPEPSFVLAGPQTVLRRSIPPEKLSEMVSTFPKEEYMGRVYRESAVMPMLTCHGVNKGILDIEKMMPHVNHPRQTSYRPADSVGEIMNKQDGEPPKIAGKIGVHDAPLSSRRRDDTAEGLLQQVNALGANWNQAQDARRGYQLDLLLSQPSQLPATQSLLEPFTAGEETRASKADNDGKAGVKLSEGACPVTTGHEKHHRSGAARRRGRQQKPAVGPPGLNKALQEAAAKRSKEAGPTSWCPGPPGSTAPVPSWMKREQASKDARAMTANSAGPLTLAGNFAMDSARSGEGPSGKEQAKQSASFNALASQHAASQGRPTGAGQGEVGKAVELSLGNNKIGKRLAQLGLQPIKQPGVAVKGK